MSDPASAGDEVRITHVFDAPREVVVAAWTSPEHVARWWAPEGFDPHAGGVRRLGAVSVPLRDHRVLRARADRAQGRPIAEAGIEESITRIAFDADGERTTMSLTSGPYTDEVRGNAEAGWIDLIANLERLFAAR